MANAAKKIIDIEKVDGDVVNESLEGVGEPTTGSLNERVERLATWFLDHIAEGEVVQECNNCFGKLDPTKVQGEPLPPRCPYCGFDGGEEVEEEVEPEKKPAPKSAAPVPKAGKVVSIRGTGKPLAAKEDPKPTKIAKAEAKPAKSEASEAELNAKLDEYRAAQIEGATNYVTMAHALLDIHERKLWKQRLDATTGKLAYKTYEEFMNAELKMSKTNFYRLLAAGKAFTEEDIQKHGSRKLALIAQFKDPADRERLKEFLDQGASKSDLEREAKKKGGVDDTEGKMKVFLPTSVTTIPFLLDGSTDDDPKPAKRAGDSPYAVLALPGGVEIRFRLFMDGRSKSLKLKVQPRKLD